MTDRLVCATPPLGPDRERRPGSRAVTPEPRTVSDAAQGARTPFERARAANDTPLDALRAGRT